MMAMLSLLAFAGYAVAGAHDFAGHNVLVQRQGSTDDFGAGNKYCTCPQVSGQPLVELNAYLPGARNYFLDCQYGTTGEPCTYNTAGAAVNPPNYCPANALPAATSGTEYCYITCPAEVNGSPLDTTQSNVVIVASGANSYTTCRYQNGANCQYNPLTGALGNTAAGGNCPSTNAKTSGCCFSLATGPASVTTTPVPVSSKPITVTPTSSTTPVVVVSSTTPIVTPSSTTVWSSWSSSYSWSNSISASSTVVKPPNSGAGKVASGIVVTGLAFVAAIYMA